VGQAEFSIDEQRQHIMAEFPAEYERVDGAEINPRLDARKNVPVPPKWVRDRVSVPHDCEWATLSNELLDFYPPHIRDCLVKYVKDWRVNQRVGDSVLINGPASYRTRIWAAAAVVNEVVMRYSQFGNISTKWINVGMIKRLVMMDKRKDPEYPAYWNQFLNAGLLLVIDPSRAITYDWIHLETLYENRLEKRLPTITTFTTPVLQKDWTHVREILGDFITDALAETTKGHIAHY
jgi:hypothetical protein